MSERPVAEGAAIVLVGCGNMGRALLRGWLDRGLDPGSIHVVEPSAAATRETPEGVRISADAATIPHPVDVIVLAVKPQVLADVAPVYAAPAAAGALIVSIAAGRTLATLADLLGPGAAIVRAMPNTPAAVGRGITGACANARVDDRQRRIASEVLGATGEVAWVDEEALIDVVTGVSGSGPAYVFLFAEYLAEAGAAAGLPAELAQRLARATVAGAGEMLHRLPQPAAELRRQVTSPGGTTAAALEVLMAAEGLQPLLRQAVLRATRRARELAG